MEILAAIMAFVLVFLTLWFQEGDLNDETIVPENPIIKLDDNCTELDKNERAVFEYLQTINLVRNTLGSSADEEEL